MEQNEIKQNFPQDFQDMPVGDVIQYLYGSRRGDLKNFRVTLSKLSESIGVISSGGSPIFFDGDQLPDKNNSDGDLEKGDWAILPLDMVYKNINGGPDIIPVDDHLNFAQFDGSIWSLIDMGPLVDTSNLADKPAFQMGVQSPVTGLPASLQTYIFKNKIKERVTLSSLNVYCAGNGFIKVKRLRESEDGLNFNFIEESGIAITSGLNIDKQFSSITFEAGDSIGFYSNVSIHVNNNPSWSGYYSKATPADITTNTLISSLTLADPGFNIQFGVKGLLEDWYNELREDLNDVSASSEIFGSLLSEWKFGVDTPSANVNSGINLTYIFDQEIIQPNSLKKVRWYSGATGILKIKRVAKSGGTYTFKEEVAVNAVIGLNKLDLSKQLKFEVGDKIAVFSSTNGVIQHKAVTGAYNTFNYFAGDLNTSTSTVSPSTNQQLQFQFVFNTILSQPSTEVKTTGKNILLADFNDNKLPDGMQNQGASWAFSNGKAIQGGLGLANALQTKIGTNFDSITIRADFEFTNATARLAVFGRITTFTQSGSVCDVNIATNKLTVYNNWNGTNTLPTINTDKTIGFTLSQNRPYRLEIIKSRKDMQFVITDLVSMAKDSITINGGSIQINPVGYAYGKAGIAVLSGTVQVDRLQYLTNGADKPLILFYGDSITEGYGILANDGYAYRAKDALLSDAYISAQSSCTPADVIERLDIELNVFKPKFIHVLIGTNSTDKTTWLTEITAINDLIVSKGITPVFGCLPANTRDLTQVSAWNADLLAKGYRVVRYDLATTLGNNGVDIDLTLFQADGIHPNAAGGLAMFNRLKVDLPELF